MLEINTVAPDFELKDSNGVSHKLSNFLGKWVLIYFYPKDNTPGCTKEACTLSDEMPRFNDLQAVVLGISADSEESHQKFTKKYGLNVTLLSDPDRKAIKKYQAGTVFTKRISYLVNPKGVIVKVYDKVKPADHASEVIEDIKSYDKNSE